MILYTVPLPYFYAFFKVLRLKTSGFLVFILVFYSILVSSLGVPLYASRSSAEDFRTKSVCRTAFVFWRNRIKNTRGTVLAAVPLLILSSYLKELRLKFSEFLPIYCSFLFYPRFLARRTIVRLSLVSRGFPHKIRVPNGFRILA